MRGHPAPDLVGQRFGRLTVVSRASNRRNKSYWSCKCECGGEIVAQGVQMRSGRTHSCGCLQRDLASAARITHGATKRGQRWPEWGVWRQMINRCYRKATEAYSRYGARGICVCDRWRFGDGQMSAFECFIADMGRRPSPDLSIERMNNDGNYEPSNCKWATSAEQAANRRPIRSQSLKAAS